MLKEASLSSLAVRFLGSAAIAVLMIGAFGLPGAVQATEVRQQTKVPPQGNEHLKPTGKGWGERDSTSSSASKFAKPGSNGISYHGGPVMLNTVKMYYIWYGPWIFPTDTTQTLLNDFGGHIGATPYFNINQTYTDSTNAAVSGNVTLAGSTTDAGTSISLSDADIKAVVSNALLSGVLPTDPNGVYFVLTSKEVTASSGFCTQYCAWHTHGAINGQEIKYGFIGNPARCPSSCSAQTTTPNDNLGADGMANLIAHELAEAVTDPVFTGWYDTRGYENADKCAWKFGATSTASNGAKYNVSWGTKWLLQQNWINAIGGYCTLAKP